MKAVNLLSVVQASKMLTEPVLQAYYYQLGVSLKKAELMDLTSLAEQIELTSSDIKILDEYFVGYSIPQISKEFDLLRFGRQEIINIELKSENIGVKILKQLLRNRYYLSFLETKVYCYTYISSDKKLYTLDKYDNLCEIKIEVLIQKLQSQIVIPIEDIDRLFKPSNYLVSPFNSTDAFIDGKYFLTARQEEIKKVCIDAVSRRGASFLSICGKAGTGKSLLTYDIAKELIRKKQRVIIVHCGILNQGHVRLNDRYRWEIVPAKNLRSIISTNYNLLIIDECQRLYPSQLDLVIAQIKAQKSNCIFSYDDQQCLREWEMNNKISKVIAEKTSCTTFELTDKIRTNREIASFIVALFDTSKTVEKLNRSNIALSYFNAARDAKRYIKYLGEQGWKIINYTPSNRDSHPYDEYKILNENNAHEVIGQEFDWVVAVIDQSYVYEGCNLTFKYSKSPYYHPAKMLFQIMTRTRVKLHVVIINNEQILTRCLTILN